MFKVDDDGMKLNQIMYAVLTLSKCFTWIEVFTATFYLTKYF